MKFRISPLWWPLLGAVSPILAPLLLVKNIGFRRDKKAAREMNNKRISEAQKMHLPEVERLDLTVLVEWKTCEGFLGDAGVSYLLKTDSSTMLYDVGFGPATPVLLHNANKIGLNTEEIDGLAISHLHGDHMGGFDAARQNAVKVPQELMPSDMRPCFLPGQAKTEGFSPIVVDKPQMFTRDIASTGPLARRLFLLGMTEEQTLIVKLKHKGLVIITGCGHPTIEVILEMVRRISDDPVYAIGGGLHFPVYGGRGNKAGIQLQTIFGTGKPPWQKIKAEDIDKTVDAINRANPQKVYLSGHDSSDFALGYIKEKLYAETYVLRAGESYRI